MTGIGLFSGGLDSILAVRVLQEQGIRVEAVCFVTPFFGPEKAQAAIGQLNNVTLHVLDITEPHFEMLKNPRYGYGRYMNPCIDCHGLMFRQAGLLMEKTGARFLFSGEVLGERPMSQNKNSLRSVEKLSGYQGYILRPLSALLLPETIPEQQNLVDRSRLLAIHGRSRKPQIELARRFGITSYPEPAGGCRLTEPGFSGRLRELMAHAPDFGRRDVELLAIGRHLRLPDGVKIIVGRNEKENEALEAYAAAGDTLLSVRDIPGPTVLLPGAADEETVRLAASICARYSDVPEGATVEACVYRDTTSRGVRVTASAKELVREYMI